MCQSRAAKMCRIAQVNSPVIKDWGNLYTGGGALAGRSTHHFPFTNWTNKFRVFTKRSNKFGVKRGSLLLSNDVIN